MTDGPTAIQVSPISETEMRDTLNSFTSKAHEFITRVVALSEQAVTLAALQDTVKALADRVTQAETANDQLRKDLADAQSLAVENKRTAEQWQRDHGIVLDDLKRAWQAHDDRDNEAKSLATERDQARSDADDLRDKLQAAESRIRYLESNQTQLETALTSERASNDHFQEQDKRQTERIAVLERTAQDAINDAQKAHDEVDRVTKDRDDWKSSYYQVNDKLATANDKLAKVQQAHEHMKQVFDTAIQSAQAA